MPKDSESRRMLLPVLSLALLAAHAFGSAAAAAAAHHYKNIFILAGQSNMVGLGGVFNDTWDGFVPLECNPNPAILRLTAALAWVPAREPLHADIDAEYACGIGPGMPFSNTVLRLRSGFGAIGLVPCAIGGTSISQWAKGTKFYGDMIGRATAAVRMGGRLRAVLWYQGEADTNYRNDAVLYKSRFESFVRDLRFDLRSPLLPVIQVALASGTGPYKELVRQAQLGTNIRNVRCVDAQGLQLKRDGLHLSTAGQVRLGQMMAQTFLQNFSALPHTEKRVKK